ncbi:MAG: hypothetical protein WC796_04765 [Candidatus Pacearchaeota archaeon]|jgi:hypothetical protein
MKRILIADGRPEDIAHLIKGLSERFEVVYVTSTNSAHECLGKIHPDAAVFDHSTIPQDRRTSPEDQAGYLADLVVTSHVLNPHMPIVFRCVEEELYPHFRKRLKEREVPPGEVMLTNKHQDEPEIRDYFLRKLGA